MSSNTCKSCNNKFTTYDLKDGKCRICLRQEDDNAYDMDMLTSEEKKAYFGHIDQKKDKKDKKQKKSKKKKSDKQRVMEAFATLSEAQQEELINNL